MHDGRRVLICSLWSETCQGFPEFHSQRDWEKHVLKDHADSVEAKAIRGELSSAKR